jgi:formylglycine-generating enzyme required for sulfatase activity
MHRLTVIAALGSVSCGGTAVSSGEGGGRNDGGTPDAPVDTGCVDAGDGGTTPDSGMQCPSLPGPAMVALPEVYCIDSTEVTRAQYAAWLATNPDPGSQIDVCSWNSDFVPPEGCLNIIECTGSDCDSWPQTCVDWCDAYSYCEGVGKRLCGKIGGGANDPSDFADTVKSQWYNACTSGGKLAFPYGDTYDPSTCNGKEFEVDDWGSPVPVASVPSCQSAEPGYAGVFDLSGNVAEFEDSCEGTSGVDDKCRVRGSGFVNEDGESSYMRCDDDTITVSRGGCRWDRIPLLLSVAGFSSDGARIGRR